MGTPLGMIVVLCWLVAMAGRGFSSGLGFAATGGFGLVGIVPFTLPLFRAGCVEGTLREFTFPDNGELLVRCSAFLAVAGALETVLLLRLDSRVAGALETVLLLRLDSRVAGFGGGRGTILTSRALLATSSPLLSEFS